MWKMLIKKNAVIVTFTLTYCSADSMNPRATLTRDYFGKPLLIATISCYIHKHHQEILPFQRLCHISGLRGICDGPFSQWKYVLWSENSQA